MLDVDHGTYPFVTSSNPTAGGACTGSGIPPYAHRSGHRVVKAYTTRVGSGPVPDRAARRRRRVGCGTTGAEFGTTTGRPRRCGWYDAVIARYAARVNGVTDFVLTKLDVLTGLRAGPGVRRLPRRRHGPRRDADDADRVPPRGAGLRGAAGLGRGHLRRPRRWTTCRRTPARTSRRSRTCPARPSRPSASARVVTSRSPCARWCESRPHPRRCGSRPHPRWGGSRPHSRWGGSRPHR